MTLSQAGISAPRQQFRWDTGWNFKRMPVFFRVAFKPPSSINISQETVDKQGNPVEFTAGGRHDVCFLPRAVPIVEAMAALVIADHMLTPAPAG